MSEPQNVAQVLQRIVEKITPAVTEIVQRGQSAKLELDFKPGGLLVGGRKILVL